MDAELGSQSPDLSVPGRFAQGEFRFAVGTVGSATLVLQTVLPALLTMPATSRVVLQAETHDPRVPAIRFAGRSFPPVINRMGSIVVAEL